MDENKTSEVMEILNKIMEYELSSSWFWVWQKGLYR